MTTTDSVRRRPERARPRQADATSSAPTAPDRRHRRRRRGGRGRHRGGRRRVALAATSGVGASPASPSPTARATWPTPTASSRPSRRSAKSIKAKLNFVPFNAGVTAIAEMRSGSLQAISGVGNPPVVGAIGNGTDVVVVLAQSFDADALIVPRRDHRPEPARRQVGRRAGRVVGGLRAARLAEAQHLTDSVKVVGLASEQAVAAAYLAGDVQGAYVQAGPEAQLIAKGGHALTDAQKIAKLGIPGLNVVAVVDGRDREPSRRRAAVRVRPGAGHPGLHRPARRQVPDASARPRACPAT